MRRTISATALVFLWAASAARGHAQDAAAARASAPIDLTGYWVAIISEDWRYRMVTPPKGDYASIPLTQAGKDLADTWDPARDEAAGQRCKAYGAPGVMRGPTRLRITWLDENTLKLETDYGTQTRLLRFRAPSGSPAPSLQGSTVAQWVLAAGSDRSGARYGSMKSVTTRLLPGYLRKNGVPYSANTVFTEYWDVHKESNGDQYLVDTNVVTDPANLQNPWITAIHFKKEPDGGKWAPAPMFGDVLAREEEHSTCHIVGRCSGQPLFSPRCCSAASRHLRKSTSPVRGRPACTRIGWNAVPAAIWWTTPGCR